MSMRYRLRLPNVNVPVTSIITAEAHTHSRYDARLLLDSTSISPASAQQPTELSSDGWSDLPSDTEDTFFFSRDEAEDYHREKRRRLIDQGREERLRALRDADDEEETREEDEWGGSDEEVRVYHITYYIILCKEELSASQQIA